MYLTFFKKELINNIDYNNIMQTPIENTIYYKKITINIPKNDAEKYIQLNANLEMELHSARMLLEPYKNNYEQQYYSFKIPKHSGGLRQIDAPNDEFKDTLTKVKDIFERNLKCLAHPAAYAYTKHLSAIDALKYHQKNKSNWYLKLDLTDFFTNCTPQLIYDSLTQQYPFMLMSQTAKNELKEILQICSLRGGLPQGTPISPLLTNLMMVPYDYQIAKILKKYKGNHYAYTRYADDLLISSKKEFDWKTIETKVEHILDPFKIKKQKTRYGSRAGQNWNLGLMLNKDNEITLGYRKKKLLNAMLNNFLKDFSTNNKWS